MTTSFKNVTLIMAVFLSSNAFSVDDKVNVHCYRSDDLGFDEDSLSGSLKAKSHFYLEGTIEYFDNDSYQPLSCVGTFTDGNSLSTKNRNTFSLVCGGLLMGGEVAKVTLQNKKATMKTLDEKDQLSLHSQYTCDVEVVSFTPFTSNTNR